ncbi:hypothetical protein, partial [Kitasatospora herbaricolor]|uniref:hypothetical protein n=1 Tax=Kitasatospora herbaricolor TaxID=68217 RepID=UPI0036DF7BCA
MRTRWSLLGAAAIAVALVVSGCSAHGGVAEGPRLLTMGFTEKDTTGDPLADWFARSVFALSHGQLAIWIVRDCCGDGQDAETRLIRGVARHAYDLGWVQTRAFERLGVPTARALTAPMLVDSYRLEQAVVDSALSTTVLADLRRLGVTGLALEPGFLRRPVATEASGPLRALSDWRRSTFSSYGSSVEAAAVTAFGARSVQLSPPERDTAFANRTLLGYASSIVEQNHNQVLARPYITQNMALWPRMAALIAHPGILSVLSMQQRAWLDDAAADARGRTGALRTLEQRAILAGCSAGTHFVTADLRDLAGLWHALGPVYAVLGRDEPTRRVILAILALDSATPGDGSAPPA